MCGLLAVGRRRWGRGEQPRMRYTFSSTMNDRTLGGIESERESDRWKDKIEVRLDNRQVFFLFFGSALVACMLFILGVMVGKRLESRGKAVAPETEAPPATLERGPAPPPAAEPTPRPPAAAPSPAPVRPPAPVARPAVAIAPPRAAPEPTAEPAPQGSDAPVKPVAPPTPAIAPEPKKAAAAVPVGKGRFTLQLGSFPDRAEAEAFAKQFGAQPYVVPSEIPGRG